MLIRKSQDRGFVDHGWLQSYHTFSFADYYDAQWMGFRSLRVINDDIVAAGQGFGMHPHRDMEIVTVVLDGQLAHQDSMGNSAVISPDEIQRMSAGTGIRHSEFNHHHDKQVHLLQIWIIPDKKGLTPSYEQKIIKQNHPLTLIASGTPDAGAVLIHQDINIYRGVIDHGSIDYVIKDKRAVWVHVIEGVLTVNGHILDAGDSVGIEHLKNVYFSSQQKVVFILFDLI